MDANFTFPTRPTPTPRPNASHSPIEPVNRESNALRASVLDAALELGIGANGAVANWMFNNTLEEEDEEADEDVGGRGPLSATSDEYAPYSTPPTSNSSHSDTFHPKAASPFFSASPNPAVSAQVHFPTIPGPPITPAASNKLRKQRRDGGYESDGGYVSDGGKKARTRTKSKTKKDSPPPSAPPISEPMELIPLTKEERKRMKKAGKSSKDQDMPLETDTEDVGKPSKSKSSKPKKSKKNSSDAGAAGYETDDGYVSSSGKPKSKRSRFFSLRKKGDSTSDAVIEPVPPMPEREVFPLPIASRFATTLGSSSSASATPSRSETPLLPPSRPFASASGSSSASSSANSLLTPSDQDSFGTGALSINPDEFRPMVKENYGNGHTPDTSVNSTITVTPPASQDSAPSRSPQSANPKSKFLISYPLTRTQSPGSPSAPAPVAQSPIPAKPKHVPNPISLSPYPPSGPTSRAPSPSPMGSPYVLLTPLNTSAPPRAVSPTPSAAAEVVPSTDFIVPSRSASPLPPSPNVLAYYDIPPPSPPPNAPLPRAPPSAMREIAPGLPRLRSLSRDRNGPSAPQLDAASPISGRASPNPSPISAGGVTSPISAGGVSPMSALGERGRAAPFPSRPVLQTRAGPPGVGPGLAARAKVQRYRDLYAIQIPPTPARARAPPSDDEVDIRVEDWESEGEEEEEERTEMLGVLGRFRDRNELRERAGGALERNNSGALRPGTMRNERRSPSPSVVPQDYLDDDDDKSQYPDEEKTAGRSTMYRFENGLGARDTMYTNGRETMYSEYSRASFLDVEKSEAARSKLVERVHVTFDLSGRERSAVPPVPKLPPSAMAAGGGNRF
ncbi:hypothetical protein B0H11DRAFT_1187899 [Mycena galericulata]|nr:hypothetical protein B0H11DRAFT_1187899 [Mycena galericulata]